MNVGNTFHFSFFSVFNFSNKFLSIYHIHFLGHIFIYTSFGHRQVVEKNKNKNKRKEKKKK